MAQEVLTEQQERYKTVLIQGICEMSNNFKPKFVAELKQKTLDELNQMRFDLYNKYNKKYGGGDYNFHHKKDING